MRKLVPVLFALALAAPFTAQADEVITVVADSTLAGNDGFIVHSVRASEGEGQSVFVFEEDGKLRVYAFRQFGQFTWDVLPGSQYLVQQHSMSIGDKWNALQGDGGNPMEAEVVDHVSITVLAGTFDCYRIDLVYTANPTVVVQSMWFSNGVGWVQNEGYLPGGAVDWRDELSDYTIVSGTGFMPLGIGNSWTQISITVATRQASWGEIKSKY